MKPNNKKLAFRKETLRTLSTDELAGVAGGTLTTAINCTAPAPVLYHAVAMYHPATTAITCGGTAPATTAITCH